jgi:hypothetical protein
MKGLLKDKDLPIDANFTTSGFLEFFFQNILT